MLGCGKGYVFLSKGDEKLWIPPTLIESRFDQGDFLRILATDMRGKRQKKTAVHVDPSAYEEF